MHHAGAIRMACLHVPRAQATLASTAWPQRGFMRGSGLKQKKGSAAPVILAMDSALAALNLDVVDHPGGGLRPPLDEACRDEL